MAMVLQKELLSRLQVRQAKRKDVCVVSGDNSLRKCIGAMIKYKVGAVLVKDPFVQQVGILSKTEILACYYTGFGLETRCAEVMVSPVLSCQESDSLQQAVGMMVEHDVNQLFVLNDHGEQTGILTFPDIVGLVYRVCFDCPRNIFNTQKEQEQQDWLQVRDVMTRGVKAVETGDLLVRAVELIIGEHFGALPVLDDQKRPVGVISKTDLIRGYLHGLSLTEGVPKVMTSPPIMCAPDCFLSQAIKLLILADVERFFVQDDSGLVCGVVSFSDAARLKSGSCKACQAGNW